MKDLLQWVGVLAIGFAPFTLWAIGKLAEALLT